MSSSAKPLPRVLAGIAERRQPARDQLLDAVVLVEEPVDRLAPVVIGRP